MQAFAAMAFIGAAASHAAPLPSAPRGPDGREPVRQAQGATSAGTAMTLAGQSPRTHQVMSGSGVAFALRFDRLVDHGGSCFVLVTPAGAERTVRPRLNAQPNTLYASVGRLAPGDYLLRWHVRGLDGGALQGEVPSAVAADRPAR